MLQQSQVVDKRLRWIANAGVNWADLFYASRRVIPALDARWSEPAYRLAFSEDVRAEAAPGAVKERKRRIRMGRDSCRNSVIYECRLGGMGSGDSNMRQGSRVICRTW